MIDHINELIGIAKYLDDEESVAGLKRSIRSLEDHSYLLTVMGQFSAGKSMLINNLLQKDALPVHITETTALVTFIKYGDLDHGIILYKDSSSEEISLEDCRKIWQNKEEEQKLEAIESITLYINSDILKNGLILVDTPGINTVLEKHVELTESILRNSDRVLYVMQKPLTSEDKNFISAVTESGIKLVFVRTHLDEFKNNEEDISFAVETEKNNLCPFTSDEVFFVSNIRDNQYYNNINILRSYLCETIAANVEDAAIIAANEKISVIIRRLRDKLTDKSEYMAIMLNKGYEEYTKKRTDIEKSLSALEELLSKNKKKLKDKYEQEKATAKNTLYDDVKGQAEAIQGRIEAINNEKEYEDKVKELLHDSFVIIQGNYCDSFNRFIKEREADFLNEIKNDIIIPIDIPDLPESLDEADSQFGAIKDDIDALLVLKSELEAQINNLEKEKQSQNEKYSEVSAEVEQIKDALDEVQVQLDQFPDYIPRYKIVEGDHSHENAWRKIGAVADWATILIPGEAWAKLGAKIFGAGKKAAQAVKAAKAVDFFADGARIMGKIARGAKIPKAVGVALEAANGINEVRKQAIRDKNPEVYDKAAQYKNILLGIKEGEETADTSPFLPPASKPSLLDYISLDYWFAKIGKNFDIPDVKVEDEEYHNRYNEGKNQIIKEVNKKVDEEYKKRIELLGIKEEAEKIKEKQEIEIRRKAETEKKINDMACALEKERIAARKRRYQEHYNTIVRKSLDDFAAHIISDVQPNIDEKMENYIAIYDVNIVKDINRRRDELKEIEDLFKSSDHVKLEQELELCKKYYAVVNSLISEG